MVFASEDQHEHRSTHHGSISTVYHFKDMVFSSSTHALFRPLDGMISNSFSLSIWMHGGLG
jgi:hypothetical protein